MPIDRRAAQRRCDVTPAATKGTARRPRDRVAVLVEAWTPHRAHSLVFARAGVNRPLGAEKKPPLDVRLSVDRSEIATCFTRSKCLSAPPRRPAADHPVPRRLATGVAEAESAGAIWLLVAGVGEGQGVVAAGVDGGRADPCGGEPGLPRGRSPGGGSLEQRREVAAGVAGGDAGNLLGGVLSDDLPALGPDVDHPVDGRGGAELVRAGPGASSGQHARGERRRLHPPGPRRRPPERGATPFGGSIQAVGSGCGCARRQLTPGRLAGDRIARGLREASRPSSSCGRFGARRR